jgi:hypothetical protein
MVSGSCDGKLSVWNAENGKSICTFSGAHEGPVKCVEVLISLAVTK